MAGAALIIKAALVSIIFGVTVDTVTVRADKYRGFMTCIAFEIVMFAKQWESGQIVDE